LSSEGSSRTLKKGESENRPEDEKEKGEMRIMWIGSAAIVLLILAALGFNMLITQDTTS
jgi:hypothetical protein